MRGSLTIARKRAASLRRSLPDSPLRGLYGALPCTSASQLTCAHLLHTIGERILKGAL